MRISYQWLQEYIALPSPTALAELLTMSGTSVDAVTNVAGDHLLELEVTSNRPDCLSYLGVAREIAALTGKKVRVPAAKKAAAKKRPARSGATVTLTVNDKKLCPYYTARHIDGVTIGASPAWLATKIERMGLRPVNTVVDITNFCLFEQGEPMHAFDADKISGHAVVVRRARRGETIVTIDGVTRTLTETMLVIADAQRPIAIAGVMGGKETEVTAATKNILLEAASFDPVSIRRTARALGISTESSYRFERRVDCAAIVPASLRATELIETLAGGACGTFVSAGSAAVKKETITVRLDRLAQVLGVDIAAPAVRRILAALGMHVERTNARTITVNACTFRPDLHDEIDLIEEIARITGYAKIPTTLPPTTLQPVRRPQMMIVENRIRDILAGAGAREIVTYSMMSAKTAAPLGVPAAGIVPVVNPLTAEQEIMRPSLIPGMLAAMARNINRKNKDLMLFELAPVYTCNSPTNYTETKTLLVGMTGENDRGWIAGRRSVDIFDVKGVAELLLHALGIAATTTEPFTSPQFVAGTAGTITVAGTVIGRFGEVAPALLSSQDIKEKVVVAELSVDALIGALPAAGKVLELPKYPAVLRDLSIMVDSAVAHARIVNVIRTAAGELLTGVELIDRYSGKQIPAGKTSLTYRLAYQDVTRTLEERDVNTVHSRVVTALAEQCGAQLR